jgi:hypothetical protein
MEKPLEAAICWHNATFMMEVTTVFVDVNIRMLVKTPIEFENGC